MKIWNQTLTTLAVLAAGLTVAACRPENAGVTPDIDEEAVATVQAGIEIIMVARVPNMGPRRPLPPAETLRPIGRPIDPDLDEERIRKYARDGTWRFSGISPIRLNEAETDLLLDRMRTKKAAARRPGT